MALHGNLRDFSLSQIFNIISLAKKNGALIIECNDDTFILYFKDGSIINVELVADDNSLASVLFKSEHINEAQFKILKDKASNLSDKELGIILVNAGYIRQEEIFKYLKNYFLSLVKRLYLVDDARFYFDPNRTVSRGKINVQLNLDNLIIESSRFVREVEYLEGEIPNLEMTLKFKQEPRNKIDNLSLSADEWRVVSFIKPGNTIKEIAAYAKLNDNKVRRVIYSLLQADIVEIDRPYNVPFSKNVNTFSGIKNKSEQKKLVAKLIDRVRAL